MARHALRADSLPSPAQEPEFASAMERYYKDVVACMGALQLVPKFMTSWEGLKTWHPFAPSNSCWEMKNRFVYALITNRGRALDVLFTRLKLAMDPNQKGWNEEEESMKKVRPISPPPKKIMEPNSALF